MGVCRNVIIRERKDTITLPLVWYFLFGTQEAFENEKSHGHAMSFDYDPTQHTEIPYIIRLGVVLL